MENIARRPLDPLAKSRAQLEQLPPALRKAAEQMLWRAKGCVESRKLITPRLVSPAESEWRKMGPDLPTEIGIDNNPYWAGGYPFLFLLPPATVGNKAEIQKTKGTFARFLKSVVRNYLSASNS